MLCEILRDFKVRTREGVKELRAGEVITLPEDRIKELVDKGLVRAYPDVIAIMERKYNELNHWLGLFDLTADEIRERDPRLYFQIQDALEGLDKAFLEKDLSSFKGFIQKVRELYSLALIKCERASPG